jgi:hypothetical protein
LVVLGAVAFLAYLIYHYRGKGHLE